LTDSAKLHQESIVVDAHCDVLTALEQQGRRLGEHSQKGHADLPRLKQGGVNVQFFAAFISPDDRPQATVRALVLIDRFYAALAENAREIAPAKNFSEIQEALAGGKIAALLTIEGGEALCGRIEVLRMFYQLGVRVLTLTWNHRNEIGDGVFEERTKGGLTRFGAAVVAEMNQLNMLVDVSHLAEAGFWDVLAASRKPVIASHSNCRRVCDHPRNLTDEQIKAIARNGGVIGLCFYPALVHPAEPNLDRLVAHVEHIAGLAGIDYLGLGSDFDGFQGALPGLEDAGCLPVLTEALLRRGYREEEIRKILGGNFLRLLKEL